MPVNARKDFSLRFIIRRNLSKALFFCNNKQIIWCAVQQQAHGFHILITDGFGFVLCMQTNTLYDALVYKGGMIMTIDNSGTILVPGNLGRIMSDEL